MYHQFKELADVDITAEPMEIGPTCHYVMGGVEVDPDTELSRGHRAVRRRRVLGRHARLQPARRQLAVGPAGVRPAGRRGRGGVRRGPGGDAAARSTEAEVDGRRRPARWRRSSVEGGENPYTIQQDLQQTMNDLVGIIRTAAELEQSLEEIEELKERAEQLMVVEGHRQYNPGWHLAHRPAQHAAGLASASRRRRWPARSRVAATPATTSRARTPEWGAQEPGADAQRGGRRASTWPRSRSR